MLSKIANQESINNVASGEAKRRRKRISQRRKSIMACQHGVAAAENNQWRNGAGNESVIMASYLNHRTEGIHSTVLSMTQLYVTIGYSCKYDVSFLMCQYAAGSGNVSRISDMAFSRVA
jgi:hypothetical protein